MWTAYRKVAVVLAIRSGAISRGDAYDRFMLSAEELSCWETAFDEDGIAGLQLKRSPTVLARVKRGGLPEPKFWSLGWIRDTHTWTLADSSTSLSARLPRIVTFWRWPLVRPAGSEWRRSRFDWPAAVGASIAIDPVRRGIIEVRIAKITSKLIKKYFSTFLPIILLIFLTIPVQGAGICNNREASHLSPVERSYCSWPDYQIIIWQSQTPARLAALRALGVTGGVILGERGNIVWNNIFSKVVPFLQEQMNWYVENIATDFYSAYHRWYPDRPVTWLFDEAKRRHLQEPGNIEPFIRTPSLSDPVWLRGIARRLRRNVRAFAPYMPLFYNLADEAGIADLAVAWDFDFGPASLKGMRVWLKARYHALAALNREWGTHFISWREVMPMTTDEALQQTDENFAAWGDFKEWMDVAFARAVRRGSDAVHSADPRALSALEGAQVPGWGGYNYSHLASTVDVMEIYDFGNNVEIAHSLAPELVTLMTSSLSTPRDIRAVWHELLLGGRGLILWDEDNGFTDENGAPTARGERLRALATELRSGIAAQLIASTPATSGVAILYSPASQRIQWLLDRKSDGHPWAGRQAENEYDDNPIRTATRRIARMLTHLGIQPRWLTRELISRGVLRRGRIRVLALPHAISLSAVEAREIHRFAARGGALLADSQPGLFDEHGRRLASPRLFDLVELGLVRLMPELGRGEPADESTQLVQLRQVLKAGGIKMPFSLSESNGAVAANIDARVFRNANATIVGLQRGETKGDSEAPRDIAIDFERPVYAYDLRYPGAPQHGTRLRVALGAVEPALIAFSPTAIAPLRVNGPARAQLGTVAKFTVTPQRLGSKIKRIAHIEAVAPSGAIVPAHTANLVVGQRGVRWLLPLTPSDPVGNWTVRISDVFGAEEIDRTLTVSNARTMATTIAGAVGGETIGIPRHRLYRRRPIVP
jgi:uncharacterized protein DUF1153